MIRTFAVVFLLIYTASTLCAEEGAVTKCPSPNGRFTLRITVPPDADEETVERNVELINKGSGKTIVSLGVAYYNHLADTILLWSADSQRVAYATRDNREGETLIYYWNSKTFKKVLLPENLPTPDVDLGKAGEEGVKNYGGAVTPVRWLKTGELELASEQTLMSHADSRTYKGVVRFTICLDAKHRATLRRVRKTRTTVVE